MTLYRVRARFDAFIDYERWFEAPTEADALKAAERQDQHDWAQAGSTEHTGPRLVVVEAREDEDEFLHLPLAS